MAARDGDVIEGHINQPHRDRGAGVTAGLQLYTRRARASSGSTPGGSRRSYPATLLLDERNCAVCFTQISKRRRFRGPTKTDS
jgi:hypothetical protein